MTKFQLPRLFGLPFYIPLLMLAIKFLVYMNIRMIYTMSPFLENDWNVTTPEMGLVVATGEFGALPAGILTPLADVAGPRKSVALTGLLVAVANVGMVLAPIVPVLIILRLISSVAATVFAAALQGAVSTMVEPKYNVAATGFLESAWGGSLLVGIPASGFLFNTFGWPAPFLAVAGTMIPLLFALCLKLPSQYNVEVTQQETGKEDVHEQTSKESVHEQASKVDAFEQASKEEPKTNDIEDAHQGAPNPNLRESTDQSNSVIAEKPKHCCMKSGFIRSIVNVFSVPKLRHFFISILAVQFAHNFMYASFAYWAVDVYDQSIEETASVTTLIGVAEIGGVAVMSLLGNRVSMVNAVIVALFLTTFASLGAGFGGTVSFVGGIAGFMCMYLPVEFVIVASIANVRTLAPGHLQVTALGFFFQAMSIGRTIGALVAPILWDVFMDLRYTSILSSSCFVLATMFMYRCKILHSRSITKDSQKSQVQDQGDLEQQQQEEINNAESELDEVSENQVVVQ